tara:strand:+ start:506 stop:652 length:147 start_codon:yes stop_codon:yes gene_type:complete
MSRLNLEAFKAQANDTQELEELSGGILGACHDVSWWDLGLLWDFLGVE